MIFLERLHDFLFGEVAGFFSLTHSGCMIYFCEDLMIFFCGEDA